MNDLVGEGIGDFLVAGEHYGAALAVEVSEMFDDVASVVGVKVTGGFIGEDDAGLIQHGAGDSGALFFTSTEFCGFVGEALCQAQVGEDFPSPVALAVGAGRAVCEKDIVKNVKIGEKMEHLKDKANVLFAEFGLVAGMQGVDLLITDVDLALGGSEHGGDHQEEGRLAAAAGPFQNDEPSGLDVKMNMVEGMDRSVGGLINLTNVVEGDHG